MFNPRAEPRWLASMRRRTERLDAKDPETRRRVRARHQIEQFPLFTRWVRTHPSPWQIRVRLQVLRALAEVVAGKRPGPSTFTNRRGSRTARGRVTQNAR